MEDNVAGREEKGAVNNCGHLETVETGHPDQPDHGQLGIALHKRFKLKSNNQIIGDRTFTFLAE